MRETRGFLALLLTYGILLGLSTCQRQDESQEVILNSSTRHFPSNLVYQSRSDYNNEAVREKSQEQQQAYSAEYYDDGDEYYDEETSADVKDDTSREPKFIKTVKASSSSQEGNSRERANGTLYEDSYYYDDDDYVDEAVNEDAAAPIDDNEAEEPQQVSEEQSNIATANVQKKPVEEAEVPPQVEEAGVNLQEKTKKVTEAALIAKEQEAPINRTSTAQDSSAEAEETSPSVLISPETSSSSPPTEKVTATNETQEETRADESLVQDSILIGEAIVSVVTTKSVVNGTFSVPEEVTIPPPTTTMNHESIEATSSSSTTSTTEATTSTISTTTEFAPSSTIVSSVQTGRSISGARYLPFPSVDKVEQLDSTESIIDKLDRVQSELSSGFLANNRFVPRRYNKKPFSVTSLTLPTTTTMAPTASPIIPPLNITSITKRPKIQTTIENVSAFLPKDFSKSSYRTSTTTAPLTKRPKIQTTIEDVSAFLPKDFPRSGYRTNSPGSSTKRPKIQTTMEDVSAFLPKDFPKGSYRSPFKRPSYKTTATPEIASSTEKSIASTSRKALTSIEDIGAFLPPGYKLNKKDAAAEKSSDVSDILANLTGGDTSTTERTKSIEDLFEKSAVDISALLPPGYKSDTNASKQSEDPIQKLLPKSSFDISALLPSGYKPADKSSESTKSNDPVQKLLAESNVDLSALLPPGFNPKATEHSALEDTTKSNGSGGSLKIVFPSRPGGRKPIHKITTPSSKAGAAAGEAATPRIQKGWPTRATTEFTGWPTSSTTPISIEKLLEAARTATISSTNVSVVPITSEVSSTSSTTTTTTTTMRPTTPGICDEDCEVAGTIKIVENAIWVPELFDRNTREWQDLAEEIEREMNLVFAKSPVLRKWFRNIRIDSFSQGSVLVDYFVELADLKEKINTQQLKVIFHDSLRTFNFDNPMEATPKGPMKLGKFTIDPKSTDFVVIPRVVAPKLTEDENRLIPQWAIAVIVIGVGGLLFIIVFGVSVLVNRQHGSKLKPPIPAMYEEEVSKNVMSHAVPPSRPASEYQKSESQTMWNDAGWHDKPFESTSHKILVDGLPYERKYNMYDSWKSEWNGYYYPPTQASGSNFSRHQPDYDVNF